MDDNQGRERSTGANFELARNRSEEAHRVSDEGSVLLQVFGRFGLARKNDARFRRTHDAKRHLSYEIHFTPEFPKNVPGRHGGVHSFAAFMVTGRRSK